MRKLILVSLTISSTLGAQSAPPRPRTAPLRGSLEQRVRTLLDQPPFDRANWGLYVVDDRGKVLFQRNADRFYVPASNTCPLFNSVALCAERGKFMLPVVVHTPVAGSNSSAEVAMPPAVKPPATSTFPSRSSVAV